MLASFILRTTQDGTRKHLVSKGDEASELGFTEENYLWAVILA